MAKFAREAFYACKTYAEIYREAFGKELSFKDPERAKLCQRLDRWIERQFSKSAAGQVGAEARRSQAVTVTGAGHPEGAVTPVTPVTVPVDVLLMIASTTIEMWRRNATILAKAIPERGFGSRSRCTRAFSGAGSGAF